MRGVQIVSDKTFVCGSLFSIPDLRDYIATSKATEFPKEFKLTMPRVKNQGMVGSCVAHSLATVTEYFNKQETNTATKMSTAFIYGNRLLTTHKGSGLFTRDAIKTVSKFGNVPYEKFPDNVEVPYAIQRFDKFYAEMGESVGLNWKFKTYFQLKDTNAIKTHLLDKNPVILTMWWYDDIKIVDGVMQTKCVKTSTTGGHCMVIYGWNETGWLVQNSWGTVWGNKGRFVLPYNIPVKETWGVTDDVSSSSLTIRSPFKTKIGAFIAKVIHKIISWFYNIKNRSDD